MKECVDTRIKPETSSACATHLYSVFNIPDLQDKAVKERVDARNKLETYLYNMKSTAEDKMKDKVRKARVFHLHCRLLLWGHLQVDVLGYAHAAVSFPHGQVP